MPEPAATDYPLEIESIERTPVSGDMFVVRLTGTWRGPSTAPSGKGRLVVEADGRHHRFAPSSERQSGGEETVGTWVASFVLPSFLEPAPSRRMMLSFGSVTIPLPADGFATIDSDDQAQQLSAGQSERSSEAEPSSGQEMISALRSELQERTAAEARLRGMLADTQAELDARSAAEVGLESTHAELRQELDQLVEIVAQTSAARDEVDSQVAAMAAQTAKLELETAALRERERAAQELLKAREDELFAEISDLRAELASAIVAREVADGETVGLRAELDRLGAEVAADKKQSEGEDAGIVEAEALLAEARALVTKLGQGGADSKTGASSGI